MHHLRVAAVIAAVLAGPLAHAVDIPPSGSINVDFTAAPGSDWQRADIAGGSGDVTSTALLDSKVASSAPVTYNAIPTTNNGTATDNVRWFGVYYTLTASGNTNWVKIGQRRGGRT
jgi:hypothetical protein